MSGRRPLRPSVVARLVLAAGLATLGLWPVSASAGAAPVQHGAAKKNHTVSVTSSAEAWYLDPQLPTLVPGQPDVLDPCSLLPIGCPSLPSLPSVPLPSSIPTQLGDALYPAGTLHVELTLGQATGKAFVVPDLSKLPAGSTLVSGTLTLPVDQDPKAGNRAVATARFGACLTTSVVTDGQRGGLAGAPDFDCDSAASPAVYHPQQHMFTIDLAPFIVRWNYGVANNGVSLVPTTSDGATSILTDHASWHVALAGRGVATGPSDSWSFTVAPPSAPSSGPTSTPSAPPTSTPTKAPSLPKVPRLPGPTASDSTPVSSPPPSVTVPQKTASAPPTTSTVQPLAAAPVALLTRPWYTYRGVVFLPLAFLLALSVTGRSLTRPLTGRRR